MTRHSRLISLAAEELERLEQWIRAGKTFWQAALAYLLADAAVLQEALTDWSTGKQLLLSLAVGAAAFAREHFSWARSAAVLADFYETVLPATHPPT